MYGLVLFRRCFPQFDSVRCKRMIRKSCPLRVSFVANFTLELLLLFNLSARVGVTVMRVEPFNVRKLRVANLTQDVAG